ncbi:MAG: hypothetical protein ACP5SH_16460 [Syntrophobacteraceae bacterium]
MVFYGQAREHIGARKKIADQQLFFDTVNLGSCPDRDLAHHAGFKRNVATPSPHIIVFPWSRNRMFSCF